MPNFEDDFLKTEVFQIEQNGSRATSCLFWLSLRKVLEDWYMKYYMYMELFRFNCHTTDLKMVSKYRNEFSALMTRLLVKEYQSRPCKMGAMHHFSYARLQTGRIMVWWCPSVRVSVRPSDSPSVRVSFRPFSALFSYMLWHIELKFCTWLCFNVLQIKFECRHFASILKDLCLFVNLEYR